MKKAILGLILAAPLGGIVPITFSNNTTSTELDNCELLPSSPFLLLDSDEEEFDDEEFDDGDDEEEEDDEDDDEDDDEGDGDEY